MKSVIKFKIIFCLFFCFGFGALAQTTKKNLLKIDLISPLAKTLSIAYETKMSDKAGIQIGLNYINMNNGNLNYNKISGIGAMLEYRLYLSKKKVCPEGFFMGFSLRMQQLSYERQNYNTFYNPQTMIYYTTSSYDKNSNIFVGSGISFGGQWVFKDVVNLSIFGGPTYYLGAENAPSTLIMTNGNGYGFTLGAMVGIAF